MSYPFADLIKHMHDKPKLHEDIFKYWNEKGYQFDLGVGTLVPKVKQMKKLAHGLDDDTTTADYDESETLLPKKEEKETPVIKLTSEDIGKSSLGLYSTIYAEAAKRDKDKPGTQTT